LQLSFSGPSISASVDDHEVARVSSTTYSRGLAALASGWHRASFDNFSAGVVKPNPPVKNALVANIDTLAFDYHQRSCNPPPQDNARLRNDFSGKVGLKVSVTRDVKVTALLRFMVGGNADQHMLEVFDVTGLEHTKSSIANASIEMSRFLERPLDPLGFAVAPLTEPVLLKSGRTYYVVSNEVAGQDKWMDTVAVETMPSSPFHITGNVYQTTGEDQWHRTAAGSFSYGPVSLYFDTEDDGPHAELYV
jgi:hypothetical protein